MTNFTNATMIGVSICATGSLVGVFFSIQIVAISREQGQVKGRSLENMHEWNVQNYDLNSD
jgi:hypothetical protein